ncbi:MAG: hypothetical protein ACRC16_07535, partial [Aeromonas salmonicida]
MYDFEKNRQPSFIFAGSPSMSHFFTLLPNGKRIPRAAKSQAFLLTDGWDDWFEFNTLYILFVFDENGEEHRIGEVKIAQFSMKDEQKRPEIPEEFESLNDTFFSLGQDDSYYYGLNQLDPELRDKILRCLCDVALDSERFQRALKEKVTGISLLRSVNRATV